MRDWNHMRDITHLYPTNISIQQNSLENVVRLCSGFSVRELTSVADAVIVGMPFVTKTHCWQNRSVLFIVMWKND